MFRTFTTGTALVSAALIGAAPAPALPQPMAVAVVQAHEVALAGFNPVPWEVGLVQVLQELAKITGYGDNTVAKALYPLGNAGLGGLTPNELLSFTGLGNLTVHQAQQLADIFGLGQNPISLLMAWTGLTDDTTLPEMASHLGMTGTSLGNLWGIVGLNADSTLGQTAANLGLGNLPIENLYWLIGITDDDTLQATVNALGIGDTPLDTLLRDWGMSDQHIDAYLNQLGVSPQELLTIFGLNPATLGSLWDPATGSFTTDATIQQFADASGLGHGTVDQLLAAGNLNDVTVEDLVKGIGLNYDDATVNTVLHTIGMQNLSLGDFASGFGLSSHSTVGDLFHQVPGFDGVTIGGSGGLLDDFGLSTHSTIDQLLGAVPGLGGTTLTDMLGATSFGSESWFDLVSGALGDTTLSQWLADILASLTPA